MKNNGLITGRLEGIKQKLSSFKIPAIFTFIFLGVASSVWFLARVIPKPSRAGYPCMKAAAPIMSGFVIYLITLSGSALFFKKAYTKFKTARYKSAIIASLVCLMLVAAYSINDSKKLFASTAATITPITWDTVLPDGKNNPMGSGIGIFPGRVVWAWSPNATVATCTQSITDAFFMPKNNNQDTINKMADNSIKQLSGQPSIKAAWDTIFKYFNYAKTGVASGYTSGQTIFIKVNNGQAGWAIKGSDLSEIGESSTMTGKSNIAIAETTPSTVFALVRQLVDSCGIPQNKIYIGEPMTHVFKSMNDLIHSVYPNVKVMDKGNYTSLGRTTSTGWTKSVIFYSDKGAVMTNAISDDMMQEMYDANYLINVAALKAHARGGVTLNAKLHFGSHGIDKHGDSFHLHAGLISTVDNDHMTDGVRGDYKMYRVLVDLMGHEKLGRNTVLNVVDGLWGGIEATDMPVKWTIAPFNNAWPNSLFMSQDQVAIQSVCLDFLRAEAKVNTLFNNRPLFPAVDDFLHQAADRNNWASGITYDPENDGTPIPGSLGVHEHWNNVKDKQYTGDLYTNGNGIDLVSVPASLVKHKSVQASTFTVTFTTLSNNKPLENVLITFNGVNAYTNSLGVATFRNISTSTGLSYTASKTGISDLSGTLDVNQDVHKSLSIVTDIQTKVMKSSLYLFPNPASGNTSINYQLKYNSNVVMYIVSMNGEIVQHLRNQMMDAGEYHDNVAIDNLKSGLYICVLKTSNGIQTAKFEIR